MIPGLTLVLGGARSGKSSFAESLILESGLRPVYLATATPGDAEMADRIHRHLARRGAGWLTVEEPHDLAGALRAHGGAGRAVLVDCLTLWLSNLMLAERDVASATAEVLEAAAGLEGPVVFVSNEVGLGIVPDNALARRFRDQAGLIHQAIAARADCAVFVVAGLPLVLKGALPSRSPS